jgi:Fur family peroxide stress response transcriptional regulator
VFFSNNPFKLVLHKILINDIRSFGIVSFQTKNEGDFMNALTIEEIKQYLAKNAIKPSIQRVRIFQFLKDNPIHPTADEIYHQLSDELITLSKTTVYNTVHLLAEKGIIQPIHIEGTEVRYDADFSQHAHFKCLNCDNVHDLRISIDAAHFPELKKYTLKDVQLLLTGICPECKPKTIN